MRIALAIIALTIVTGPTSLARADEFWAEAAGENVESDYSAAMRNGDVYAERAARLYRRSRYRARSFAYRAIEAYERAAKARPETAEPHYRAAAVLYAHYIQNEDFPEADKIRRAIEHWQAFERLAPMDPRLVDILINRSLAQTHLATKDSLKAAAADYERILSMLDAGSVNPASIATWTMNAAEIHMMLGELSTAIAMYERALDLEARALYAYGLAVALDRDYQGARAREVMRAYAITDRLRALDEPGVFYVPKGEIFYYYALGYEVLGDTEKAIRYYESFIASGANPQFQDRARKNMRALEAATRDP